MSEHDDCSKLVEAGADDPSTWPLSELARADFAVLSLRTIAERHGFELFPDDCGCHFCALGRLILLAADAR